MIYLTKTKKMKEEKRSAWLSLLRWLGMTVIAIIVGCIWGVKSHYGQNTSDIENWIQDLNE